MDIKYLKGVGDKRAEAFAKLGVTQISDFLSFVPRIYVQRTSISGARKMVGGNVVIYGKVTYVQHPSTPRHPVTIELSDSTGIIEIPVFGASEFRVKQFRLNENYLFYGKVSDAYKGYNARLDYRDHFKLNTDDEFDRDFLKYPVLPVYELSGLLKATWVKPLTLTRIVFNAFRYLLKNTQFPAEEKLPERILEEYSLPSRSEAVLRINFPKSLEQVEQYRKRLAFEELFYLQILFALKKRSIKEEVKGISFDTDIKTLTSNFVKTLNFELTGAQKKVINEIYSDMKSVKVMNRLLQGDVGSGKTVVSLFGMLIALQNGYQSAFMCPTEILAEQHFSTITNFVRRFNEVSGLDYKVTLLIGGQKKKLRQEILADIKSGRAGIIIGTHALIQETVEFANLGFVVIDEQHKFGVMQRAKLKEKGLNPDVLVMTATPIPRTLSIAYYGDLDVSVIDELPVGRKPVKTYLKKDTAKNEVWSFVKENLRKGRQAFIIYPIIEESEKLDLKSAEENFKNHKENVFREYKVGMVHGRMFWYEIEETMNDFKAGKIDVLVATTVIEVGIDIPNATVMVVEEAQRFGLSQLHQLRGRVGRGAEQSHCILIAKYIDEISGKRLETLCVTTDGFKIAQVDMEIRGPGEFFGTRQSGILEFSATDLIKDSDVLQKARDVAFKIIDDDPHLRKPENKVVRDVLLKEHKDSMYLMNIA